MTTAQAKAIAAPPHQPALQGLEGQVVVVKLSGKALAHTAWAGEVAALRRAGALPVVVHGAGPQISALGEALGLQARFVEGLRVTDAATLQAAEMALAAVGKTIVGLLQAEGLEALGLSGRDAALLQAAPRSPALGLVGRITGVNAAALARLLEAGFVPVLNPIAAPAPPPPPAAAAGPLGDTSHLNTNADEAARAVAVALKARALLLLSDVDGVQGLDGRVATATPRSIAQLRESGQATGGMLPKLEACSEAVLRGVGMVRILRGEDGVLAALDASDTRFGTLVVQDQDADARRREDQDTGGSDTEEVSGHGL